MFLLFDHVMLLCETFIFILLREGSVYCKHHPIDTCCTEPPAYPFTQIWFASAAPLILPLEAHQSCSEISHREGSRELAQDPRTQRAVWMGLLLFLHTLLMLVPRLNVLKYNSGHILWDCAFNVPLLSGQKFLRSTNDSLNTEVCICLFVCRQPEPLRNLFSFYLPLRTERVRCVWIIDIK